jgi:hypothetical protein
LSGLRFDRLFISILVAIAAVVTSNQPALAQTVQRDLYVTNGTVRTVTRANGVVYIGGTFTALGPMTGPAIGVDPVTGGLLPHWPKVKGHVINVVLPDGSGGWYIGGDFTHVNGAPRRNLAHILADHTLDSWTPGTMPAPYYASVAALVLSGSTLYVGGNFTQIAGQTRNGLAAIDAVTGALLPWNPNASGGGPVNAIALNGNTMYVSGSFTKVGGAQISRLAAVDVPTGGAIGWVPDPGFGGVDVLAWSGTTLYVAGSFTTIAGMPRPGCAAFDGSRNLLSWNPHPSGGGISVIAPSGGIVYLGGSFNAIDGQFRNAIAAVDATTGVATAWNPNPPAFSTIGSIVPQGGTMYVAGKFSTIGGQNRVNVAELSTVTGNATAWNVGPIGAFLDPTVQPSLSKVGVGAGAIFISGYDSMMVPTHARSNIAALDAVTGMPTDWNPGANGGVNDLVVDGGIIYVGGGFSMIGGQPRSCAAALNVADGTVTAWNPTANGGAVNVLAVSGGLVYAGGTFTSIGGQSRSCIAALNTTNGNATSWNPSANNLNGRGVSDLAIEGTTVYVVGDFTAIGGAPRDWMAAVDASTGLATPWNPHPTNTQPPTMSSVLVDNGIVYVSGGLFSTIGGQFRNTLAALDAVTGQATSWNPSVKYVGQLALDNDAIYVAGDYSPDIGSSLPAVGAVDKVTGLVSWKVECESVSDLWAGGGTFYIGGGFHSTATFPCMGLAGLSTATVGVTRTPTLATDPIRLSPNPTRTSTQIDFMMPRAGHAEVAVYDVRGRMVGRPVNGVLPAGRQVTSWSPDRTRGDRAGIYFVTIDAVGQRSVARLVVFD